MSSPSPSLLALHGLRLKGLADVATVADLLGVDRGALDVELKELAEADLVVERPRAGAASGPVWRLTSAGRDHHEALLAAQLDDAGIRAAVESHYAEFVPLNRRLLELCTRWQVRSIGSGEVVLNDHTDPAHDRRVLDELARLHLEARSLLDVLVAVLDRIDLHRRRLDHAMAEIAAGDHQWIDGPLIDSYHTVWFELHEDLLATLGLDRAAETATHA